MTKYQFFKALGYVDEEIVEEVNNVSVPKRRMRLSSAAIACALIVVISLASGIVMYSINVQRQKVVKKESVNIVVNEVPPVCSKIKPGHLLVKVLEEMWYATFPKAHESFIEKHDNKYYLPFSDKYLKVYMENKLDGPKPNYGVIRFELSGGEKIQMVVQKKSRLSEQYGKLQKSKIGDYDVIVCKEVKSNWEAIILGKNGYTYSFEVNYKHTKEQITSILKEILE